MQVPSLGWEDTLEKEMATHSTILAWRHPWDLKELDVTEQLSLSLFQGQCSRTIHNKGRSTQASL